MELAITLKRNSWTRICSYKDLASRFVLVPEEDRVNDVYEVFTGLQLFGLKKGRVNSLSGKQTVEPLGLGVLMLRVTIRDVDMTITQEPMTTRERLKALLTPRSLSSTPSGFD